MSEIFSYLSVSEVARLLRRTPTTVRNWLRAGKLEGCHLPGGQWAIPVSAVAQELGLDEQDVIRAASAPVIVLDEKSAVSRDAGDVRAE